PGAPHVPSWAAEWMSGRDGGTSVDDGRRAPGESTLRHRYARGPTTVHGRRPLIRASNQRGASVDLRARLVHDLHVDRLVRILDSRYRFRALPPPRGSPQDMRGPSGAEHHPTIAR